jgi:uncharacterized oligopeptide transporter (OPT) family protein
MLVGWAILSPLSKLSGWAPGPTGDMTTGARGWILWTSLGIMCADSFVSLLPVIVKHLVDLVHNRHKGNSAHTDDKETETEDRLVPMTWVLGGVLVSIIVGTVLVGYVFDGAIKPWATALGFVCGSMLSVIA